MKEGIYYQLMCQWMAWAKANEYWEKDWPDHTRDSVNEARAYFLAEALAQ